MFKTNDDNNTTETSIQCITTSSPGILTGTHHDAVHRVPGTHLLFLFCLFGGKRERVHRFHKLCRCTLVGRGKIISLDNFYSNKALYNLKTITKDEVYKLKRFIFDVVLMFLCSFTVYQLP